MKNNIKINCELPINLLNVNYNLNDYDFVLFHLYISNKVYREYYKAMRIVHPTRTMILDNSAYEFYVKGETLDLSEYAKVIEELHPDYYILPDILMNQKGTLELVDRWFKNYMPESDAQPMAVAQGETEQELLGCLCVYKTNGIMNICLPFHNSFFKDMRRDPDLEKDFADAYNLDPSDLTEDMKYASGRVMFVYNNIELLEGFNYIHLLGSHCPLEKAFYRDSCINSMDTGYPVKLAFEHGILGREKKKPDTIIDNFIDKDVDNLTRALINVNVGLFKEY